MKEKYQTELLGALHETAVGLHRIGVISNEEMQEYDKECLVQESEAAHPTENLQKEILTQRNTKNSA
jgi:DNA-binding transcriptional regulator YiaG